MIEISAKGATLQFTNNWHTFYSTYLSMRRSTTFVGLVDGVVMPRRAFSKLMQGIADVHGCYGHCQSSPWGCRLLKSVQLHLSYYDNYWYKFGHFEDGYGSWVVHKNEIRTRLLQEVKEKGINMCHKYMESRIEDAIGRLPDTINMTLTNVFCYSYDPKFIGDDPTVPTGIMHRYEPVDDQAHEVVMVRLN